MNSTTDLARLLDEQAIMTLSNRYTDALNRRDFATMRSCYAADAVWRSSAPIHNECHGIEDIMAFNERVVGSMDMLLQACFTPVIEIDGDRADLRCTAVEYGRSKDGTTGMMNFGLYLSEVRRQPDGRWLFTRRLYHVLFRNEQVTPGAAFPPPDIRAFHG